MPDVALDRADVQRFARLAVLAEDGPRGVELDRVAEGGAGAVCLQVRHRGGVDPCVGERGCDDLLLRGSVRHGEAGGRAVLVDRAAVQHRQDPVAVSLCVAQPLRTRTPQPSARTNPLASAEEVLQRPSGESMCARLIATEHSGDAITLTPPASTRSVSPDRRDLMARCSETREDEHAVSTAIAGPESPSR